MLLIRRYCLAFLHERTLPWLWEPIDRVTNIKRQLFKDACAVHSDACDANLVSEENCSTRHCLDTYKEWDVPEALHALWDHILDVHAGWPLDYDACIEALNTDDGTRPCEAW